MRLYLKLLAILLIAAAIQSRAPSGPGHDELWFALRCQLANLTHDEVLKAKLVDEQYQIIRRQHEEPITHMNAAGPG
jgi:hypothetical protein